MASQASSACSSSTRGIIALGFIDPPAATTNTIEYITISTLGNSFDFGDLSVSRESSAGLSSPIRGLFGGWGDPETNLIEYVTIASLGDAIDFGDLTVARKSAATASNSVRGVFATGWDGSAGVNVIDYVTIATTGNAADFGDYSLTIDQVSGCSDSHGGLG